MKGGATTGQEVRERLVSYIRENQTYFYRLAYQYVGDRDLAMDLVQDAVVKALQHWESLREPEAVRSWFYRILVRECLSFLRQNRRVIYLAEPPEQVQSSGESAWRTGRLCARPLTGSLPNSRPWCCCVSTRRCS